MSQVADELWEGLPFEGQLAELRQLRKDEATAGTGGPVDSPTTPADGSLPTAIIVIGAGGDLAKKKTYPALYKLFLHGLLPNKVRVWGLDRLEGDHQAFREKMRGRLEAAAPDRPTELDAFLAKCFYCSAQCDCAADFRSLNTDINAWSGLTNRLYYLAIPPFVFAAAVKSITQEGMAIHARLSQPESDPAWTRVIVEKPFGHDLKSSDALDAQLGSMLAEEQIYRIDHYLGKEMVQNLSAVRFGNVIFEPLWNRFHIATVTVTFKEDLTVEGRAGYFDNVGLIRDVMQNHLLQLVTLVAMEPPVSLSSEDVRNEKVKVLKAIKPLQLKDVVLGQYEGYTFDPEVPDGSLTETYAQAVLNIDNSRWRGVPFIVKCAKASDERKCEIRIQFEESPLPYFRDKDVSGGGVNRNEMVIRIQPNEAMYLKTNMKKVGQGGMVMAELDLSYHKRFPDAYVPEAYEKLISDCLMGEHANFVRNDELRESWKIFDGMLKELHEERPTPLIYKRGTRGPPAADQMLIDLGVKRTHAYSGPAWKKMRASSSTQQLAAQAVSGMKQGASLGLPATTSHGAPEKRSEASQVTFNAPSTQ